MINKNHSPATWLIASSFSSACAEAVQAVAIAWLVYKLTANTTLVGIVNAAAYLPGVIFGLYFQRKADLGQAENLLKLTNLFLFIASLSLAVLWNVFTGVSVTITAFLLAQGCLSLIKLLNKAYLGRFLRGGFEASLAVATLTRSTTFGIMGGLCGALLGGLSLDFFSADWCFGIAAGLYLVSLVGMNLAIHQAAGHSSVDSAHTSKEADQKILSRTSTSLILILVFSIPGSGALPYLSTLTVPLAHSISPDSSMFYSILEVILTVSGFTGGLLLSSSAVSYIFTMRYALLIAAIICPVLAYFQSAYAIAVSLFFLSLILTSHVITMQVLTNQTAPPGMTGKFTVIRNSVAGTAKAVFSIAAGWIEDISGLGAAWIILSCLLGVFAVGIFMFSKRPANT